MRDGYAMSTEEHPNNVRLNLYNRFEGDLEDLLRVNPNHELGRNMPRPSGCARRAAAFVQPAAPAGRAALGVSPGHAARQ